MVMMMQAAAASSVCSSQVGTGALRTSLGSSRVEYQRFAPLQPCFSFQRRPQSVVLRVRAQAEPTGKPSEQYVDYEGRASYVAYRARAGDHNKRVFPDEACEDTGEGCDAEGVFKEVAPSASAMPIAVAEQEPGPDREYEEYSGEKTVFPGEACEELGGEFCEPEFQEGVFPEKVRASKS